MHDLRKRVTLAALGLGVLACGLALPSAEENAPAATPAATPEVGQDPAGWSAVVLGPARGHLEPCGCSGGQQGGIDRLASVLASASRGSSGVPAPRLAAGGVVGVEAAGKHGWAMAQLESIWEAYAMLGLDAVGLAASDGQQRPFAP